MLQQLATQSTEVAALPGGEAPALVTEGVTSEGGASNTPQQQRFGEVLSQQTDKPAATTPAVTEPAAKSAETAKVLEQQPDQQNTQLDAESTNQGSDVVEQGANKQSNPEAEQEQARAASALAFIDTYYLSQTNGLEADHSPEAKVLHWHKQTQSQGPLNQFDDRLSHYAPLHSDYTDVSLAELIEPLQQQLAHMPQSDPRAQSLQALLAKLQKINTHTDSQTQAESKLDLQLLLGLQQAELTPAGSEGQSDNESSSPDRKDQADKGLLVSIPELEPQKPVTHPQAVTLLNAESIQPEQQLRESPTQATQTSSPETLKGEQMTDHRLNASDVSQPIAEASLQDDTGVPKAAVVTPVIEAQVAKVQADKVKQASADLKPAKTALSSAVAATAEPAVQASQVETQPAEAKPVLPVIALLNLSDKQLDNALNNLSQRVALAVSQAEQRDSAQPVVSTSVSTDSKQQTDFVGHLKTALAEIKQQLQEGHQPTISLKALVSEAIAQTHTSTSVSPEASKLEPMLRQFAHTLDTASQLHSAQSHPAIQHSTLEVTSREVVATEHNKFSTAQNVVEKAVNITKPEGHNQLAEKVRWMVNARQLQADIRLDPPDLGGMQIKISMQGEAASVSFVVQSQQARDVLDQAVPRLREMLAEKGIALGQSSVQQEQKQRGEGEHAAHNTGHSESAQQEEVDAPVLEQRVVNGRLGGIDYFV